MREGWALVSGKEQYLKKKKWASDEEDGSEKNEERRQNTKDDGYKEHEGMKVRTFSWESQQCLLGGGRKCSVFMKYSVW